MTHSSETITVNMQVYFLPVFFFYIHMYITINLKLYWLLFVSVYGILCNLCVLFQELYCFEVLLFLLNVVLCTLHGDCIPTISACLLWIRQYTRHKTHTHTHAPNRQQSCSQYLPHRYTGSIYKIQKIRKDLIRWTSQQKRLWEGNF